MDFKNNKYTVITCKICLDSFAKLKTSISEVCDNCRPAYIESVKNKLNNLTK